MRPLPSSLLAIALAFTLCAPAHAEPPGEDKHDLFGVPRNAGFVGYRITEGCASAYAALTDKDVRKVALVTAGLAASSIALWNLANTPYVRTATGRFPPSAENIDTLLEQTSIFGIDTDAETLLLFSRGADRAALTRNLRARLNDFSGHSRIANLKYIATFGPSPDSEFEDVLLEQFLKKLDRQSLSFQEADATMHAFKKVGSSKWLRLATLDFHRPEAVREVFGGNPHWLRKYAYRHDYSDLLIEPLDAASVVAARIAAELEERLPAAESNALLELAGGNPYAVPVLQEIGLSEMNQVHFYRHLDQVKSADLPPNSKLSRAIVKKGLEWASRDWKNVEDPTARRRAAAYFRLFPQHAPADLEDASIAEAEK